MTDTRYSADELRQNAIIIQRGTPQDTAAHVAAMLRQAARDAETLAGIRAWLERESKQSVTDDSIANAWGNCARWALEQLDRLSRGDA
jgi:polyphosphate kinase